MRSDFGNLESGQRIKLFPNAANPLHREPVMAIYAEGYFYCDGTMPEDGPDYYFGDVLRYCDGFTVEEGADAAE